MRIFFNALQESLDISALPKDPWLIGLFFFIATILFTAVVTPIFKVTFRAICGLFGVFSGQYLALTGDLKSGPILIEMVKCRQLRNNLKGTIDGVASILIEDNRRDVNRIASGMGKYRFDGFLDGRLFVLSYQSRSRRVRGAGLLVLKGDASGTLFSGQWSGSTGDEIINGPCSWIRLSRSFPVFNRHEKIMLFSQALIGEIRQSRGGYGFKSKIFGYPAAGKIISSLAMNIHEIQDAAWRQDRDYRLFKERLNLDSRELEPRKERISDVSSQERGLVSYWKLDDGPGTTISVDSNGNFNGTLEPSGSKPRWVRDIPNILQNSYTLSFNGKDNFVDTKFKGIGGSSPRTVFFWIKVNPDASFVGGIVAWGNSRNPGKKWHIRINDREAGGWVKGAIRTEIQGGNITGSTNIADGKWHNVASVFSGGSGEDISRVQHYIDGKIDEASKIRGNGVAVNTDISSNASSVTIGRRTQATKKDSSLLKSLYFDGLLAEVRIYDRALNSLEIENIARGVGFISS